MPSKKFPRLAFVDLETTGGTAIEDRITEIGIIEVDDDGVREWSSLVNPEMRIPSFIQSLTGISDAMVQDAPVFAEIASEVAERLQDRIFIAHNARFDHGFLKNEFRRTGHTFRPPVLCTVRLSRTLFPGFARHNLDALVERHRLQVSERHRALGDARLIWQFWQRIHEVHVAEDIDAAIAKLLSRPTAPSHLDTLRVDAVPSTPGIYLFYGQNDLPLYVGKSTNLHRRVLQQFSGDHVSAREQKLSQQIHRIDWVETEGELGALLLEAMLVKRLQPVHNHQLRDNREVCSWRLVTRQGRLQALRASMDDLFFAHDPDLYGLFNSSSKANDALRGIAQTHGLCQVLLGLEKGKSGKSGKPCFASQVGKCGGACAGKETHEEHDARVRAAMQNLRLQPWPFCGAIVIREGRTLHVLHSYAYLGTADSLDAARVLLAHSQPAFDRDIYQILQTWLPRVQQDVVLL